MNKLLICLLFLVSCRQSDLNKSVKVIKIDNDNGYYRSKAFDFDYNNHSYIEFQQGNSTWGVHDPDCKCKK